MLKNSTSRWGLIAIILHWLVAITVIGMFALGLWMESLDSYHEWFERAPHWHASIGMLLLLVVSFRLAWRLYSPAPQAEASISAMEQKAAKLGQALLYVLLFATMLAGYLLVSAEHTAVAVFDWFNIPAPFEPFADQEDIMEELHEVFAYCLIGLASIHALAALKHHFIDRNNTLRRMLGMTPRQH